jgi:hypothetical protein
LGLEAQRASVDSYLNGGRWKLVKEFVEVESGKNDDRPVVVYGLRRRFRWPQHRVHDVDPLLPPLPCRPVPAERF